MAAKKKTSTKKPRRGVGAKGSRQAPAVDEGPKWKGGGKKGEDERKESR